MISVILAILRYKIHVLHPNPDKPVSVFISYSHQDESFRIGLEKHLSMLQRRGVISVWNDRKIQAGREWEGQIHRELQNADVLLLLTRSRHDNRRAEALENGAGLEGAEWQGVV